VFPVFPALCLNVLNTTLIIDAYTYALPSARVHMLLKKIQIIKGAALHLIDWVHSPNGDIVIPNPNFPHGSASKNAIVIYCVHGAVDRSASFKYISEHLIKTLPANVASIILVAFKQRLQGKSIASYANQLICKILKNRHDNIILMGHSMGGLVAATAAEELKEKKLTVNSVITICSPLKGTPRIVAPFNLLAHSLNEMMPDSNFLVALQRKIKANEIPAKNAINYFFISSADDVVCPADGCFISSKIFASHCLHDEGHLSIMNSDKLVQILNEYIHARISSQL
jgi:pimeloyl-ACP methyl ester carboxylesterase